MEVPQMLLAEFGTGQVFWSMLWFFLFFMWVYLLIVYLIARGHKMQDHARQRAAQSDAQFRSYVQDVTSSSGASPAGEIARLADLRDRGVISEAEFAAAKAKALA
jgi:hypothetical protein